MLSFHLVTVDAQTEVETSRLQSCQMETVSYDVTLWFLLLWEMSTLYFDEALAVKKFSGSPGRFTFQSRLDLVFMAYGLPC